jgi:hypothetical protein
MQSGIDIFVLISGGFSVVATVPLIYLATPASATRAS